MFSSFHPRRTGLAIPIGIARGSVSIRQKKTLRVLHMQSVAGPSTQQDLFAAVTKHVCSHHLGLHNTLRLTKHKTYSKQQVLRPTYSYESSCVPLLPSTLPGLGLWLSLKDPGKKSTCKPHTTCSVGEPHLDHVLRPVAQGLRAHGDAPSLGELDGVPKQVVQHLRRARPATTLTQPPTPTRPRRSCGGRADGQARKPGSHPRSRVLTSRVRWSHKGTCILPLPAFATMVSRTVKADCKDVGAFLPGFPRHIRAVQDALKKARLCTKLEYHCRGRALALVAPPPRSVHTLVPLTASCATSGSGTPNQNQLLPEMADVVTSRGLLLNRFVQHDP